MKIVTIDPLRLTVRLDLTDCLALVHALTVSANGDADYALNEALAAGLLGTAFAAFLLAREDAPHTVATMWERWAPKQAAPRDQPPVALPDGLPAVDDRGLRRSPNLPGARVE